MYVQLVCDTDIIVGYRGTRTTWGSRGCNIIHVVLGLLETSRFNISLSFERWFEIQGNILVSLVLMKVASEDLEWSVNINSKQKGFFY